MRFGGAFPGSGHSGAESARETWVVLGMLGAVVVLLCLFEWLGGAELLPIDKAVTEPQVETRDFQ